MWILNSVPFCQTELFIVRAIFVNPHQNFISNDKADWTRAIKQNTISPIKHESVKTRRDLIYLTEQFAGNLRHGLQGQISADGPHSGAEGDQTGARGRGSVYGHQGGLSAEGPQTC